MRRSHSGAGRRAERSRLVSPSTKARPAITSIPRASIQDALEAAARDPVNKTVFVHAGTYRPPARGQALIWFNARHDGITLEAVGDVDPHRRQPRDRRSPARPAIPAVVNHVVYFGDGVSRKTVLRGFKITGAEQLHHRLRREVADRIRRHPQDAVLLHRRRRHQGLRARPIRRSSTSRSSATTPARAAAACRSSTSGSRRSRCSSATASSATTARRRPASAFDLLHGSRATLENCLFVGNVANLGVDYVGLLARRRVPPRARLRRHDGVRRARRRRSAAARSPATGTAWTTPAPAAPTSTRSSGRTRSPGGISPGARYELDITDGAGVQRLLHPRRRQRPARTRSTRDANTLDRRIRISTRSSSRRRRDTPASATGR